MIDFKQLLDTEEYRFLKTEPHLGKNIMLLGSGGSYAYGTNHENSDIDFRGVTLQMPSDLIGMTQSDREKHIMKSVQNALSDFNRRYGTWEKGFMRLYIDRAETPELDTEIFIDANYRHLPLREYSSIIGVMHSVLNDYNKIGKRNKKKDDNHLNKHAMHLIRLFMMAIDILESGEIRTHRRNDLELLMKIRNGGFRQANRYPGARRGKAAEGALAPSYSLRI